MQTSRKLADPAYAWDFVYGATAPHGFVRNPTVIFTVRTADLGEGMSTLDDSDSETVSQGGLPGANRIAAAYFCAYFRAMLAILSPAKRLDFDPTSRKARHTRPELLKETAKLVKRGRELSAPDLMKLMGISQNLADLNVQRFQDFRTPFTPKNAKPAILAFKGDVYLGFDVDTLDAGSLRFAQNHLRILSGLYGVLRPLDLIQPYRLEMGIRLPVHGASNLYEFWGDRITDSINQAVKPKRGGVVVNLASNEYFGAVQQQRLKARLVNCVFKEVKNGESKVVAFFAKRARGIMARFICEERVSDAEGLKDFRSAGYRYNAKASTDDRFVFQRKSATA